MKFIDLDSDVNGKPFKIVHNPLKGSKNFLKNVELIFDGEDSFKIVARKPYLPEVGEYNLFFEATDREGIHAERVVKIQTCECLENVCPRAKIGVIDDGGASTWLVILIVIILLLRKLKRSF